MQIGNWVKLEVKYLLWTPGRAAADRIEKELHSKYAEYNLGGEWFDLSWDEIESQVDITARVLYPLMTLSTHSEMLEYSRRMVDARDERILARLGYQ